MNTSSVETTLRSIGSGYQPGLLLWLKRDRFDLWTEMKSLEDRINRAALAGNDAGLKDALSGYRDFFPRVQTLRALQDELQGAFNFGDRG